MCVFGVRYFLQLYQMDYTSFLIWNARGLNDRARRDTVRKVVDSCKPLVVCIQETKLAVITERDVISCLGQEFQEFVYLGALVEDSGCLETRHVNLGSAQSSSTFSVGQFQIG